MAFHITVETDAATYADWYIPKLDLLKSVPLPAQNVVKPMQVPATAAGGTRSAPRTFRVRIRSVPADSDEAKRWSSGQLPVPVRGASSPRAGSLKPGSDVQNSIFADDRFPHGG